MGMKQKLFSILSSLVLVLNVFGLIPHSDQSVNALTFNLVDLQPTWTTGLIGTGANSGSILIADFNLDEVKDIAACNHQYAYVLNQTSPDEYEVIWYSQEFQCSDLAKGDRDSDGILELYIATQNEQVIVLNGADFGVITTFSTGIVATGIAFGDVDGDGAQELAVTGSTGTSVFDAKTYTVEWSAVGYGGDEVEIGNIDSDMQTEIVVNGYTAYVLDASQKKLELAYAGGFGEYMSLGEVDGDGRDEILYSTPTYEAVLLDADTLEIKWQRDLGPGLFAGKVLVSDVNGDGLGEAIVSYLSTGDLVGLEGNNGTTLWTLPVKSYTIGGIGVGDVNDDDIVEIIWGADNSTLIGGGLFIASWVNQTLLWHSDGMVGPLFVASGDIDLDGQVEIVMASLSGSIINNNNAMIHVYDGATYQLEWSFTVGDAGQSGQFAGQLAVGQLDLDPALEILIATANSNGNILVAYDGSSREVEWTSSDLRTGPAALLLKDINQDGIDEIIVALGTIDPTMQVFHRASNVILWSSNPLKGWFMDLSIGDLEGDGILDLAILHKERLCVYEVNTWLEKHCMGISGGIQTAISPADKNNRGELIVVSGFNSNNTLLFYDHTTYAISYQTAYGGVSLNDMVVADIDNDQYYEIMMMGDYNGSTGPSFFGIATRRYPSFWKYHMKASWGNINGLSFADLDNDGQNELLFGSERLIQSNEMLLTEKVVHQSFTPIINKSLIPRGIFGTVKDNSLPAAGVDLSLRFFNGSAWSTIAQTKTDANGYYAFKGVPELAAGQAYYVLYQNTPYGDYTRLWTWHTRIITTYNQWIEVPIGNFDLHNVSLRDPIDNSLVTLPAYFSWTTRPFSPDDSYELNIFDYETGNPYFYTDPPLGYSWNYYLYSLPPGFIPGKMYVWEVWVYSPDGGFGISYYLNRVTFTNYGPTAARASQPTRMKNRLDLDLPQNR